MVYTNGSYVVVVATLYYLSAYFSQTNNSKNQSDLPELSDTDQHKTTKNRRSPVQ